MTPRPRLNNARLHALSGSPIEFQPYPSKTWDNWSSAPTTVLYERRAKLARHGEVQLMAGNTGNRRRPTNQFLAEKNAGDSPVLAPARLAPLPLAYWQESPVVDWLFSGLFKRPPTSASAAH